MSTGRIAVESCQKARRGRRPTRGGRAPREAQATGWLEGTTFAGSTAAFSAVSRGVEPLNSRSGAFRRSAKLRYSIPASHLASAV